MINDRPSNIDVKTVVSRSATDTAGTAANAKLTKERLQLSEKTETVKKAEDIQPSTPSPLNDEQKTSVSVEAKEAREALKERINEAIPKVREVLQQNQRSLDFRVAENENRVIITVIDKETEEVIRQIPPEDLLGIANSIEQGVDPFKSGSILNSKA